jgi:hypothetical protein
MKGEIEQNEQHPIAAILKSLISNLDVNKVKKDNYKETLKNELNITGVEKITIWNESDYYDKFTESWTKFLHSNIDKLDNDILHANIRGLEILITRTLPFVNNQMSDLTKFLLYYIVDNMKKLSIERVAFYAQKLKSENIKGNRLYQPLAFMAFDTFFTDYRDTLDNYQNSLNLEEGSEVADSLLNIDHYLSEFIKKRTTKSKLKGNELTVCLAKLAIFRVECSEILQLTVNEKNESLWHTLKKCENLLLTYLIYFERYCYCNDFSIENYDEKKDYYINFAEVTYFKHIPIMSNVKINPYEKQIEALLDSVKFRKLFEHILNSEPVKEFYKHERELYFEGMEGGYYVLPEKMNFFWNAIKLIPLPMNIAGATTKMLTIYINTTPKPYANVENFDQELEHEVI